MDPHLPDFKGGKISIPYNIMTSIKLEEGPYSTLGIKFESPTFINTMGLGKIHGIAGGKIVMKGLSMVSLEQEPKN